MDYQEIITTENPEKRVEVSPPYVDGDIRVTITNYEDATSVYLNYEEALKVAGILTAYAAVIDAKARHLAEAARYDMLAREAETSLSACTAEQYRAMADTHRRAATSYKE